MAEKNLKRCVIVCASPDADAEKIKQSVTPGDYLIAADGGMAVLDKVGLVPDLFVGDFDSYSGIIPEGVETIRLKTHKDDTDSMHCASIAKDRGYREVCLLGASGGSVSHTYSNFCVLSYLYDNNINAVMSGKKEDVRVIGEGEYRFKNLSGRGFSVFPFGCKSAVVSYIGSVEYPADNLELSENSSLGKSNVFRSDDAAIVVKKGKAIVFINNQ